jgi:O-antigen ligase
VDLSGKPLGKPGRLADAGLFGVFCVLLALVSLPLASNRSWALGLVVIAMLALLAAVALTRLYAGVSLGFGSARWVVAALAGFAGLLVVQRLPGLGSDGGSVSLDAFNTLRCLLATLAYLAAFMLTIWLVRTERRMLWLLGTLVLAGVVQAVLAVALYASNAEYLFLFYPFHQGHRATGTFANPDHLAGYMELCLSAGIGLMLARMSSVAESSRRQRIVGFLNFLMSPKMLVRLMLVVMVVALVLTRSRMGNMAFFSALALVGGCAMLSNPRLRRAAFWLIASLIVIDIVVIGQWVGLDRVVERLQNTAVRTENFRGEETLEQRAETPREALGLVSERPVMGFGAGSFYTVFPRFKSAEKVNFWDHAHNDYVEIAADTGVLGLGLLGLVVVMTMWRTVRLMHVGERRLHRGVAFGVTMATGCLLIHSWVDFNLQIPANALTFCVLLASVWVLVPCRMRKAFSE